MDSLLNLFGVSYTRSTEFWTRELPLTILIGGVTAVGCALFFVIHMSVFRALFGEQVDEESGKELTLLEVYPLTGDWRWIIVTGLGGFLVGVLMLFPCAPGLGLAPTMFKDLTELEGHPAQSPAIVLSTLISLATGMSIGPEMALSAMGTGLATFIGKRFSLKQRTRFAITLAGMGAAFGALLRTPVLGVMLMTEFSLAARPGDVSLDGAVKRKRQKEEETQEEESLMQEEESNVQHDYMEQMTIMGVSAVMSFLIFNALNPSSSANSFHLSDYGDFELWHLFAAVPLGLFCGLIGTVFCLMNGLGKLIRMVVLKVAHRCHVPMWAVTLVVPTFAGVLHGVICMAYPLCLGSGIELMPDVIFLGFNNTDTFDLKNGDGGEITPQTLIFSAFFKIVTTGLPIGLGIIGGQIFPTIFAGMLLGFAIPLHIPSLPAVLTVPCCMASIIGSFLPTPMTITLIPVMAMGMTPTMAAPVFLSVISAYLICGGLGLLQFLGKRTLGSGSSGESGRRSQNNNNLGELS